MSETVATIRISVNGETRKIANGTMVTGLITELGLDTRKVAVELNREIVPRSTYSTQVLADGDALEIVHFIGGG